MENNRMAVKPKKPMTLKRSMEIVLALAVAGKPFAETSLIDEDEMDEAIRFLKEKWAKVKE